MFKRLLIVSALGLISSIAAYAQQADPAFMQRAITALQTQRNSALDAQAIAEAKVAGLTEDLSKAQARIKELETPKAEPDKK